MACLCCLRLLPITHTPLPFITSYGARAQTQARPHLILLASFNLPSLVLIVAKFWTVFAPARR